jgi:hypothetical protein
VGGGGDDGGISKPPLLWIAEGAVRAGLILNRSLLEHYADQADPSAKFQAESFSLSSLILKAIGMRDRAGPAIFDEVSLSARLRASHLDYNPPPLRASEAVARGLADFKPDPDPQLWFNP